MFTRIAVYSTIGYLLDSLGFRWDSAEFWCFLGLFLCVGHLGFMEGYDTGLDKALSIINKGKSND